MPKLFVYLASRKKDGIKVVTILEGPPSVRSPLTDLTRLNLPQKLSEEVGRKIHEHRMLYEPFVESAGSYNELRDRLVARGFHDLPMGCAPLIAIDGPPPTADTKACRVERTMTRRRW